MSCSVQLHHHSGCYHQPLPPPQCLTPSSEEVTASVQQATGSENPQTSSPMSLAFASGPSYHQTMWPCRTYCVFEYGLCQVDCCQNHCVGIILRSKFIPPLRHIKVLPQLFDVVMECIMSVACWLTVSNC